MGSRHTSHESCDNELGDHVINDNDKDEGDEHWDKFKRGMEHDLDDLKLSLKKTAIQNG